MNAINGIHRLLYVQYNGQQDQEAKQEYDRCDFGRTQYPTTSNGWFVVLSLAKSPNENSTSTIF
jgi:hypothetical protein